ncbi:ABC transporter permease [Ekhidna sp. To15]|uniref:ABC transporter permease n=1 Tax=Ekhidna sp. To15 TaxID=3395267 RepID=UPI003F5281F8
MSSKKTNFSPPKSADRFLEFFCKEEWVEPLKGDLFEQYQLDRADNSRLKSNYRYWVNTINFIRPFAIKKNAATINHIAMLRNILKTFTRQLIRKPLHHSINIFGLSFGLIVVFLTMLWINYHHSFDQFHANKDQIYKVFTNSYSSGETQTATGAILEVSQQAEESVADIEHITRIIANWRWPSEQCFKIDEDKPCIYSKGIFADSSFFKMFDFEIISGQSNPLINPKSIALSESVAKKLYGDVNPVGKEYLVDNHFKVTISAIYKDVHPTSSLQFEFIAPLELAYSLWGQKVENMKSYSFITYLSLRNNNHKAVENQINSLPIADKYENLSVMLHPLNKVHLYNNFKNGEASGGLVSYVRIIGLFAIFILTMSMVNFVNLTTAQSSLRGKEIGVRKVNGASKASLHFQFLIETLLKVVIASAIAIFFTYALLPYLNRLIDEEIQFVLDRTFILKLTAIIVVTTLLSGIYPALVLSRFNPIRVLKNLPFKGGEKKNIRRWLTITQITISGVIILLTSVFYLQLDFMQNLSTGYDRKGILIMEPTFSHIRDYDAFIQELKSNPLVSEVGACNANMINADYLTDQVSWSGKDPDEKIQFKPIGAENGLLKVFEFEMLAGSYFNSTDTTNQIILTESALQLMNLNEPIGHSIDIFGEKCKIVGVISDFNSQSFHESLFPTIIYQVKPENTGTFYIRYDNNQPVESIAHIEKVYDDFEPFFNMKSKILDEEYAQLYQEEKVISSLSIFAMVIAIIIAAIGILGLSTFNTIRRYREIGLRKIFGASGNQIIQTLSKEFIWIAFVANLIAWPLSFWIMDYWLSGFAYRIEVPYGIFPINLILTAAVILLLVAIQSLRVINVNPTEVIRDE